jgi:hopene-associated glycosyltransferase HpnB
MFGESVVLSIVTAGIWVYLLLFRGGFWREMPRAAPDHAPSAWPEVVAVIPARNEADVVGEAMAALLAQDYPGRFTAILVDDDSTDGTAEAARGAAGENAGHRLEIVRNAHLPEGWTGKLWAVNHGLDEAARLAPGAKYVLLTDADIRHEPASLRGLVRRAEAGGLKLVSLMARLKTDTPAERALIPAYIFFFQKLYPFAWVNDPRHPMAAAAGGCMLVDRAALNAIGGIAAIRNRLIDDCALGQAIKAQGPVWLGLADRVISLRGYPRWRDAWMLIARSAFTQLGFSALMLMVAVASMLATYLLPPVLTIFGHGAAQPVAAIAWLMMAIAYQPTLRYYGRSPLWVLALPLVALFYTAATIDSAFRYWRGRGGAWKGRLQAQTQATDSTTGTA